MISVVIPIYNEIRLLDELHRRCVDVMDSLGEPFEIIFIDDGSDDGSLEKMIDMHKLDRRVKIIELSRNFGHQMAISAGMEHASGDLTVIMDGDLQDPPEIIPDMVQKLRDENLDVVNAARATRGERLPRKILANLFHWIFRKLSHIRDTGSFGNFAVVNRTVLKSMLQYRERSRYLPGIRASIGFRQGTVEYARKKRKAGKSKMSIRNLFNLAFDAFFSFSKWPIKMASYLGIIGFAFFAVLFYIRLHKPPTEGLLAQFTPGDIALLALGCIQLLFIGIIGEYLFRAYKEVQQRPVYVIRNTYFD
jgi:dolichol-phosphate mannosyltransferase